MKIKVVLSSLAAIALLFITGRIIVSGGHAANIGLEDWSAVLNTPRLAPAPPPYGVV